MCERTTEGQGSKSLWRKLTQRNIGVPDYGAKCVGCPQHEYEGSGEEDDEKSRSTVAIRVGSVELGVMEKSLHPKLKVYAIQHHCTPVLQELQNAYLCECLKGRRAERTPARYLSVCSARGSGSEDRRMLSTCRSVE